MMRKKRLWALFLLCASAFASCACSTPNFYPLVRIKIGPPVEADALERIDGAAKSVGFVRVAQREVEVELDKQPAIVLMAWEWPAHRSTRIDVSRAVTTGQFFVDFYDNQTHGWKLSGVSCQKYLEFLDALKNRFQHSRLVIPASCDSNA